jgi:hypothetical protein
MLEEARGAGAHGVIGVTDVTRGLDDLGLVEFHLTGTAVRVRDAPPPTGTPWSTYLSGQRFSKLIEAGWMPVSVIATLASVYIYESCVTEMQLSWGGVQGGLSSPWGATLTLDGEVEQLTEARQAALGIARDRVRHQLGRDELHGASVAMSAARSSVQCTMRGTRVRRFKPFDPVQLPVPTVRLR